MKPRRFGTKPLLASENFHAPTGPRENEQVGLPLPAPTGQPPYRLKLADVIAADPLDVLSFAVLGDTGGIVDAIPQQAVAAALLASLPASKARFAYIVGDWIYFNGEDAQWFQQMYEPYDKIPLPFMGIPGNHDGDALPGSSPLAAFVTNLCAPAPVLTKDAGDSDRDAMTQPNVFWSLTANLVTIIGLYSGVPSGGEIDQTQAAWLESELAAAPKDRPVIVALHHPPYSCDASHGGSQKMGALIDNAATLSGRWPDLVLSGHVHDYQRLSRTVHFVDGTVQEIPYIVCGGGGYHNLHTLASDVGPLPWQTPDPTVTLEAACDNAYGFLTLTIAAGKISGVYSAVTRDGTPVYTDSF